MNNNQIEFSTYWAAVANTVFYSVAMITKDSSLADKILDHQRDMITLCILEEFDKTFFNTKMRPKSTVWLENLHEVYPEEANKLESYIRNCVLTSKSRCYENIITIAAGGTAAIAGIAVGKKKPVASALLFLGGAATAGYKVTSALSVDTNALQKEVKKQFDVWKIDLLNILTTCDGVDPAKKNDEP